MRRLLVRQLVQTAPVVVALLALGLAAALVETVLAALGAHGLGGPARWGVVVVAGAAPWLLGVAAVAPDLERGDRAFLGTLPLSPWRELAARVAAGLAALVAVDGVALALAIGTTPRGMAPFEWAVVIVAVVALALYPAGLLAGVVVGRSLGALLVAPLLLLAPLLGLAAAAAAAATPPPPVTTSVAAPLILFVAAWAAFVHARPRRPSLAASRVAFAVVGAGLVLTAGLTTAAWAGAPVLSERVTRWEPHFVSSPRPLAWLRTDAIRPGWSGEGGWLKSRVLAAGEDGAPAGVGLELPPGDWGALVAPDGGRALLVGLRDGELLLVDLRAGTVLATRTGGPDDGRWRRIWCADPPVAWRGGRPCTAGEAPGTVEWFDGTTTSAGRTWPVVALGGDRALLARPDGGLIPWDLGPGGPAADARPALPVEAGRATWLALSPDGRRALARQGERLVAVRLDGDGTSDVDLGPSADPAPRAPTWTRWSPAGDVVAGVTRDGRTREVILEPGRGPGRPVPAVPCAWSPDGRRYVGVRAGNEGALVVVDLDVDPPALAEITAAPGVSYQPLWLVDPATAVNLCPWASDVVLRRVTLPTRR